MLVTSSALLGVALDYVQDWTDQDWGPSISTHIAITLNDIAEDQNAQDLLSLILHNLRLWRGLAGLGDGGSRLFGAATVRELYEACVPLRALSNHFRRWRMTQPLPQQHADAEYSDNEASEEVADPVAYIRVSGKWHFLAQKFPMVERRDLDHNIPYGLANEGQGKTYLYCNTDSDLIEAACQVTREQGIALATDFMGETWCRVNARQLS